MFLKFLIFYVFFYYFDVLVLKINLIKIKIYYFNAFPNEKTL